MIFYPIINIFNYHLGISFGEYRNLSTLLLNGLIFVYSDKISLFSCFQNSLLH